MSIPFDSRIAVATLEPGMVVELPAGTDEHGRAVYERYTVVMPICQVLVRNRETGEERYIGASDGARLVETWRCRPDDMDVGVPVGEARNGSRNRG